MKDRASISARKNTVREHWKRTAPREARFWREIGRSIAGIIQGTDAFQGARYVALFSPLSREPHLDTLWEAAPDRCVYPVSDPARRQLRFFRIEGPAELQVGYAGILEPPVRASHEITGWGPDDLILVPGYAFDRQGYRVGSGGGFYDRFLAGLESPRWGVCWSGQLSKDLLAREPTDVRMDAVCTERELLWCKAEPGK